MFKNGTKRVNVKARLNRHLRIIKENIGVGKYGFKEKTNSHFNIVLIFVLLVIPVYPSLASFMYNTSSYDFYRGDIDESSIIESYYGGEVSGEGEGPMLESISSFLSVNTILDDQRDVAGTNEIVNYEVKAGDSFSSIAYNFKVSTNSIYWANNFEKKHTLHPGDVIKVPPVSGLIHQIKSGDTISSIAEKYEVAVAKIFEQNGIEQGGTLIAGEVIVIPGAIKKAPPPPPPPPKPVYIAPKNNGKALVNSGKSTGNKSISQPSSYNLVKRGGGNSGFAWGNCTWHVAQYKKVTWRGNANQWMANARAKGVATGYTPSVGAIVQFSGRGYNPVYGHVGIVTGVTDSEILVSDMNYRRLNEVTYRKVSKDDRTIQGYIYVD
ncbi:MAG: LysM peptidoglycan-binding domain-containing protein [Candidatus Gracilibacteria bacterium]|nr:LysM peptidoglycan-binding domain-containing protein [Candidatus Gracilibacteria bacterium]